MEGIYAHADIIKVYKAILDSTQEIAHWLRYHSVQAMTTQNQFGKQQSDLDLKAQEVIERHFKKSGVVYSIASEEKPYETILCEDGEYCVTFDPIDGTSVIDANYAIASTYAIWRDKKLDGLTGRDMAGGAIGIYGSRSAVVVYNSQAERVEELTLMRMGTRERWIVTTPSMVIAPEAKLFAPALRSTFDNEEYMALFLAYCEKGYSIRYSGCMVVDNYQILVKGQGVYSMLESTAHPSRVRLIYECLPCAYLLEKAKGVSTDGEGRSILDIEVKGFDQRVSYVAGSSKEVDFVIETLKMKKMEAPK